MILSRTELSASSSISFRLGFFVSEFEKEAPCQDHGVMVPPYSVMAEIFWNTRYQKLSFSAKRRWASLEGNYNSLRDS